MTYNIINRIKRKLMHMRLHPIHVYCLHHVCAEYDAESMNRGDWMDINEFKSKVLSMQQSGIKFISLFDAHAKISNNIFRFCKYAVLTFDDGYASLKEVLPWLNEQHIPATLFINGKYLDGKSYRKNPKERYLTKKELFSLASPYIEVGSHGWEHTDASQMSTDGFKQYIESNVDLLHTHLAYIPCHAYTWGRHTAGTDAYLHSMNIIPVYIDGMKNYNELNVIHRELF